MKTLKLEDGWRLAALVDDNSHLTLFISNDDESEVVETQAELVNNNEYRIRFTTEFIEKIYQENLA